MSPCIAFLAAPQTCTKTEHIQAAAASTARGYIPVHWWRLIAQPLEMLIVKTMWVYIYIYWFSVTFLNSHKTECNGNSI